MSKHQECCCQCEFQIELRKHPSNQEIGGAKGSVLSIIGWVCDNPELQEENKRVGIFFDTQHGLCECFKERINYRETLVEGK